MSKNSKYDNKNIIIELVGNTCSNNISSIIFYKKVIMLKPSGNIGKIRIYDLDMKKDKIIYTTRNEIYELLDSIKEIWKIPDSGTSFLKQYDGLSLCVIIGNNKWMNIEKYGNKFFLPKIEYDKKHIEIYNNIINLIHKFIE